jgi:hypothetical protein
MSNDPFTWTMSAYPHKSEIDALRLEIREAHANGTPLPTGLLLDLVPLRAAQAQDLAERAPFAFTGDHFESAGDALRAEIYDPVLDVYYLSVPDVWSGTVTITGEAVTIVFDTPIQLEIPRLAALGVSRSKFQKLTKINGDSQRIMSQLVDDANGSITIIDVHLLPDAPPLVAGLTGRIVAMASSPCPGMAQDDWNVYERKNSHGFCVVHEGDYIYGGGQAYDRVFGPDTKDKCEDYARQHCPLSHGG